jgi:hypothetical protein
MTIFEHPGAWFDDRSIISDSFLFFIIGDSRFFGTEDLSEAIVVRPH